ncbi:hypothetical protein GA0115237_10064 [Streptomyces sp. ScaeMP-6W]|nr:hypothetical protein GA0115237_10064 [Streptomyces sp. ScaeMP-6W]
MQVRDEDRVGDRRPGGGGAPRRRRRWASRRAKTGSVSSRTPESSTVQVA